MNELFWKLLDMSLTACIAAAAVIAVRLIFRKMPKKISVLLWAVVAVRLLLPYGIKSPVSLIPERRPLTAESFAPVPPAEIPPAEAPEFIADTADPVVYAPAETPDEKVTLLPGTQKAFPVLPVLWLCGTGAMLAYAAVSYFRLRRKTAARYETENGVYLCDDVASPFILGILRPKIFLPSALKEEQRGYVLAHEKAHIARLDHLWKPLGFVLLSVYWFNPVLWLCFVLLCRDIEAACDEKVIEKMSNTEKADYSQVLADCAAPGRSVAACPLAFGETGVKARVKNILNYKKPTFWVIAAAVIVSAALAVFFLTDPVAGKEPSDKQTEYERETAPVVDDTDFEQPQLTGDLEQAIHGALLATAGNYLGECITEGHITVGTENTEDGVKAYLFTEISSYGFVNGYFTEVGGCMNPAVLVLRVEDGLYVFSEKLDVEDGELYGESVTALFPKEYRSRVMKGPAEKEISDMNRQCAAQAQAYLDEIGRTGEVRPWNEIPHPMVTDRGVSAEVWEKIDNATRPLPVSHGFYIGSEEIIENGARYILRTDHDEKNNTVTFTKEDYETGETLYRYEFDGNTGEMKLPVNVFLAEGVSLNAAGLRDAQKIGEYVSAAAAGNGGEKERAIAFITGCSRVPTGTAGLYDGLNVYKTEFTVKPLNGDTATNEAEYEEYLFLYYTNDYDACVLADAMTYEEIKEKFGGSGSAQTGEPLLAAAAIGVMNDIPPSESKLRALYPEYFDLDADGGLDVYAWKMSENSISFTLKPHSETGLKMEEFASLTGVSAAAMRVILKSYGLSPEKIGVYPVTNPASSYYWEIDGGTVQSLREMLELD